jgi:hypothetical protein
MYGDFFSLFSWKGKKEKKTSNPPAGTGPKPLPPVGNPPGPALFSKQYQLERVSAFNTLV